MNKLYGLILPFLMVIWGGLGLNAQNPCASTIQMSCGQTYTASLVPNSGSWTGYTNVSYSYTGSEQVWSFTAPVTGPYTFNVNQGTADADFFLMDACSNTAGNLSSGYWTGSSPGTSHTVTLAANQTVYLIADLYSGASSATTVTVSVDCPSASACTPDMIINTTKYSNTGLTTCDFENDFSLRLWIILYGRRRYCDCIYTNNFWLCEYCINEYRTLDRCFCSG